MSFQSGLFDHKPSGFVVVDKPSGMTSRDVVNIVHGNVRRQWPELSRTIKCGHAGTLDPLAEGVLVVAVGSATRLIDRVQQQIKTYRTRFRFGHSSPTGDLEGELTAEVKQPSFTAEQLQAEAEKMLGTIVQRPPQYSAIKIKGRRAYRMARKGKQFEVPTREVEIHEFALDQFAENEASMSVRCGSGTYVRSLGIELGRRLGTTAVMTYLRRVQVGVFDMSAFVTVDQIKAGEDLELLPVRNAIPGAPVHQVDPVTARDIQDGQLIALQRDDNKTFDAEEVFIYCGDVEFAIAKRSGDRWHASTVLRRLTASYQPRVRS